jgi:hypothetical protein
MFPLLCLLRVLIEEIETGNMQGVPTNLNPFNTASREPAIIIERNEPFHVSTAPTLKSVGSDIDTLHSLRDRHSEITIGGRAFGSTSRPAQHAHPVPQAKPESVEVG